MQAHLPARIETVEIDSPHCQSCGLGFTDFPGTEDSEVLEIEVKAYRRVVRRRHAIAPLFAPVEAALLARLRNVGKTAGRGKKGPGRQ